MNELFKSLGFNKEMLTLKIYTQRHKLRTAYSTND